jgi:hypothetical protein
MFLKIGSFAFEHEETANSSIISSLLRSFFPLQKIKKHETKHPGDNKKMVEELSEYLLVDILYRAVDTTCPKYTLTTAHKFASVCKKWRQAALSDYAIYLIWSKVDPMAMYMSYLVSNFSRTRDPSEHPKVDFSVGFNIGTIQ